MWQPWSERKTDFLGGLKGVFNRCLKKQVINHHVVVKFRHGLPQCINDKILFGKILDKTILARWGKAKTSDKMGTGSQYIRETVEIRVTGGCLSPFC
jgi:hypothetical protein